MLISDRLHEKTNFTNVEINIAEYLLENQDHIKNQSAHYIANQLYTSPSMITRFCQKIGYQGFNDFKEAYLQEIAYLKSHFDTIDPNYPFKYNDKNIVVANKIGSLYHEIIDDTLVLLDHDSLQNAINALKQSQVIYLYSAGVQADLAKTFKDKMLKIGKNVVVETRMNEIFYRALFADKNDLFIIISYSGEVESLLRGVEKLKERNIPIIAITSYGKNSLSKLASHVLYVASKEKLVNNLGSFSMNLATLLLLDILYVNIFNDDFKSHQQQKLTATKGFDLYRKSDNSLIEDD
ncbi:MurR/RpiR family transcriptional regulator [Thomasclavelia sp.]|uniref:MurR/RpiR family transcriptional regulator n=1 Tax=Thomasclavelia sp. TaxID=3025757 RepID=UPI0025DE5F3A|nr:MurR/RpiR family transcriptional regulator [Thomasclavelia sp.]